MTGFEAAGFCLGGAFFGCVILLVMDGRKDKRNLREAWTEVSRLIYAASAAQPFVPDKKIWDEIELAVTRLSGHPPSEIREDHEAMLEANRRLVRFLPKEEA